MNPLIINNPFISQKGKIRIGPIKIEIKKPLNSSIVCQFFFGLTTQSILFPPLICNFERKNNENHLIIKLVSERFGHSAVIAYCQIDISAVFLYKSMANTYNFYDGLNFVIGTIGFHLQWFNGAENSQILPQLIKIGPPVAFPQTLTSQKLDQGRNKIKLDPINEPVDQPVDRQKKLQKLVNHFFFNSTFKFT